MVHADDFNKLGGVTHTIRTQKH